MSYQKPAIEVVAFTNSRKKSEKAPDITGTITFNEAVVIEAGTKFDLALWNRVSKGGNPFMSGVAKPPFQSERSMDPPFPAAEKPGPVKIDF